MARSPSGGSWDVLAARSDNHLNGPAERARNEIRDSHDIAQQAHSRGLHLTRVVCQQLAPLIGNFEANHEISVAAIRDAVAAGADVIVLPELVTSGYLFASAEEVEAVAVTPEHVIFADWADAAVATAAVVIGGFVERGSDGLLYNSAALVDPTGVRAVYRKTHLWDQEKLYFAPGPELPPVVNTRIGWIAMLICYDLEFPELTRAAAIGGADLIAVPTNWPLLLRPPQERPPEVIIGMAAARVNHVAIAVCDRTGTERGQKWTEGTSIINEQGWIVDTAGAGPGRALADLDLALGRDKRLTVLAHALGDRRPELYAALTETLPRDGGAGPD